MWRNYLSTALSNLIRNRFSTGITVVGLAIGFATALLIGLYVRDEYSYDKFVPGYQKVYRVSETRVNPGEHPVETDVTSAMLAKALKLQFPQIQAVARLDASGSPPTVKRGDFSASEQNLVWADPDFFRVIPLPAIAGDPAQALSAPDGVVVTRSIARKYFGRDAPVGETLLVNDQPMHVTAVLEDLPSNTHLNANIFASSLAAFSDTSHQEKIDTPLNEVVATYFRLQPGASAADIEGQLPAFVQRYFPLDRTEGLGKINITLHLTPLADIHLRPSTKGAFKPAGDPAIIGAIGAVGLLTLLVAGINFVTLMTARATRRAVEVGVRKTAGATRRDLILQFMGEAFLQVVLAAVAAAALAELMLPAFNGMLQRRITFDYVRDPLLDLIVAIVVAAVGLAAGAYPAFVLSAFRPAAVLKGGAVANARGGGIRQVLVVVQFSVLIGLVLFAITLARQTLFSLNEGMRLNKDQVLLVEAKPCNDPLRDAMRAVPGVRAAACASAQALALGDVEQPVTIDGRNVTVSLAPVDFDFFKVYGLTPVAGRLFDESRPADAYQPSSPDNPPLVINETAARRLGFASPHAAIGATVYWPFHTDLSTAYGHDPARASQIVGVVPDFTFGSMRSPIPATFYMIAPKVSYYSIALNLKLDPHDVPGTLQRIDQVWRRMGDGAPIQRYFVTFFTLRLYMDAIEQGETIVAASIVALSIAVLGLFALSSYTTEIRTKEIGIRKAMGASSSDILRLLMWQFSKPVLWASLIASGLGFFLLNWWLQGFAYHVSVALWSFVVVAFGALLVAWATVFIHARKAALAKPVTALRYE